MFPLKDYENVTKIIHELNDRARKMLSKFDSESSDQLKSYLSDLEYSYEKLKPYIKSDNSNFNRHISFLHHYLDQDNKESCKQDIIDISTQDIAEIEKSIFRNIIPLDAIDKELKEKVFPLLNHGEYDSAIRKSFVIFKERISKHFLITEKIDGSELINYIYGSKGLMIGKMDEDERQSMRNMLDGLYGVFRNKYGHNDIQANWEETQAVLSLINWALKNIENTPYH